jgi:2-hydroxychromene-2-carboxylate isomerase
VPQKKQGDVTVVGESRYRVFGGMLLLPTHLGVGSLSTPWSRVVADYISKVAVLERTEEGKKRRSVVLRAIHAEAVEVGLDDVTGAVVLKHQLHGLEFNPRESATLSVKAQLAARHAQHRHEPVVENPTLR